MFSTISSNPQYASAVQVPFFSLKPDLLLISSLCFGIFRSMFWSSPLNSLLFLDIFMFLQTSVCSAKSLPPNTSLTPHFLSPSNLDSVSDCYTPRAKTITSCFRPSLFFFLFLFHWFWCTWSSSLSFGFLFSSTPLLPWTLSLFFSDFVWCYFLSQLHKSYLIAFLAINVQPTVSLLRQTFRSRLEIAIHLILLFLQNRYLRF